MEEYEQVDKLLMELRRGTLALAALSQLAQAEYGYSLKQRLADQGLEIDEGTLYPLLRRLEAQGLLQSEWKLEEARPRRYYVISKTGREVLALLIAEWKLTVEVMNGLLEVAGGHHA